MEIPAVISEVKGLVREVETYYQSGNVKGAATHLINIADYIKFNIPIAESTPPPSPESPPSPEPPSPRQTGDAG